MTETDTAAAPSVAPSFHGPATGKMLASFALPARDGRMVRAWDYRQRASLVILFLVEGDDRGLGLLRDLAAATPEIRAADGAVVAITADELPAGSDLPFPVLRDPEGAAAARQGLTVPAVVLADRFGEIWAAWDGAEGRPLPSADDVLGWLAFVEVQCPECEPPEAWGDE
jgi:peroxiredoxin